MASYFITATGTDIGKTFVTAALTFQSKQRGTPYRAIKPVISGFDPAALADSDATPLLQAQGLPYDMAHIERISPFRFCAPLSPHLAAAREGRTLDYAALLSFCRSNIATGDVLIEGVGGVMVPLDDTHTVLDWMRDLEVPAILVTGAYLGTLSHTLTAAAVMRQAGIPIRALIVSDSKECGMLEDTVASLRHYLPDIPSIFPLPRQHHWQSAPSMLGLLA